LGEVQALPATLFAQYRFMESTASIRPYMGLGLTYAYFSNETGSGALTSITNPGGTPTRFKVDSQWTYTAQVGATFAIDKRWFVDVFYSVTPLKTKTTFSTGQTQDITLDPSAYGLTLGFRF
jgi:outer membrane protein